MRGTFEVPLKENLTFVQQLMDTFWSFASWWFALVAILLRRSLPVGTVLSSTPRVKLFLGELLCFRPKLKGKKRQAPLLFIIKYTEAKNCNY